MLSGFASHHRARSGLFLLLPLLTPYDLPQKRRIQMYSFGSNPIDTAKKCFAENLRLFGNAQTQPEKFNLYNGLHNLAIAIEQMQQQVEQKLQQIDSDMSRIRRATGA